MPGYTARQWESTAERQNSAEQWVSKTGSFIHTWLSLWVIAALYSFILKTLKRKTQYFRVISLTIICFLEWTPDKQLPNHLYEENSFVLCSAVIKCKWHFRFSTYFPSGSGDYCTFILNFINWTGPADVHLANSKDLDLNPVLSCTKGDKTLRRLSFK